ncbi:MAG: phosphatase PAP2 family protein [Prevotellaceae bacterium]|nr:phosphatase PAP2 family protein [Prevotella sp.]MDD6553925.1 phosphatase PAP2 family protein [Prevotellaceae bacterium]
MEEKNIILTARVLSMVFTPFYLPIVGLIALFIFSYMSLLPLTYKLFVVILVYLFTVLLPTLLIRMYRNHRGWRPVDLGRKERRVIPYIISILCYFGCLAVMGALRVPRYLRIILVAALAIQMLCALVNVWWKISTHTAAIGGVAGGLLAFADIFSFNPTWWLCFVLILSGMVGTSRMILRQHTLSQVLSGFALGFLCSYIII